MKTRTKGNTKTIAEAEEASQSTNPKVQLGPESSNPPHLFILPEEICKEARIVSLTNPRYSSKSRYIVCPERGFYEFTKISAPKTTPRSWLLSPEEPNQESVIGPGSSGELKGYITRDANLFIATSVDPLFFLLPALTSPSKGSDPAKKLFLSGDDYLESFTSSSSQLAGLLRIESLRVRLQKRMAAVCETVDAGDETMYRLSEEKLLQELLQKAKRMMEKGLPKSMEEKLIVKALDVPVLSIKRGESSSHELAIEEVASAEPADSQDSQTTVTTVTTIDSAASSFSEVSKAATSFSECSTSTPTIQKSSPLPPIIAPEGVVGLLRLRTAFFFICSNYVAPHLHEALTKMLSSEISPTDFTPLDNHLAHLTKLRKEALAARSFGDYSRKRSVNEDDETLEIRAEKKRKKDEEEKRKKAGVSLGVKKLQKVNTSGMKKMSDFFKKK